MEKLSTEITTLLNKIQEVSEDYADLKDIFLDDNSVELFEDSVSTIKFLNNSRKAFSLIKFKFFLKGLNHENVDKESISMLIEYVDNPIKAEFITNSFAKIVTANSKLACCIMGLMLNEMTKNKREVSQEELMILQALPMLNDFDIKNFNYLYQVVLHRKGKNHNIMDRDYSKAAQICHTTTCNIKLTVDVLEKYNLVDKDADVSLDIDADDLDFSSVDYDEDVYFNSLSDKLYMYSSILFKE